MSVSSRRTYDTDSITLRRIFAYDLTNSPFSTGFVLTSLTNGVATFSSPSLMLSTIGISNLPAQLSSVEGQAFSTFSTTQYIVISTLSTNQLVISSLLGNFTNAVNSSLSSFYKDLPSSQEIFLPSTVTGLGSAGYVSTSYVTSTIVGLGTLGYLSSSLIGDSLQSTVAGLGSAGYVSTSQLVSSISSVSYEVLSSFNSISFQFNSSLSSLGTLGFISASQLFSTVEGLGSAGYVSSSQLVSTTSSVFLNVGFDLLSTSRSLGTQGYISSAQLVSSFRSSITGLGTVGYISSGTLTSTVNSLGTRGYISSLFSTIRSTFTNRLVGNWCNAGFLYSNIPVNSTIQTFAFDMGNSMRNQINLSTTNLDIEFKPNLQFGYFDSQSIRYDFSTCLVRGVSLSTINIIGQENYSYYILNANAVNLPFFFRDRFRFIINDVTSLSTIKNDPGLSTLSLFHYFSTIPTTNQFFAFPAQPASISVVLDNSTRNRP